MMSTRPSASSRRWSSISSSRCSALFGGALLSCAATWAPTGASALVPPNDGRAADFSGVPEELLARAAAAAGRSPVAAGVRVVEVERQAVPVFSKGEMVAFRISYVGAVRVGKPAQEFKVIFDTGSGHVVLPSKKCGSQVCLKHRRYDMDSSVGAFGIQTNGEPTQQNQRRDHIDVTFGVGQIGGELVKDELCLGRGSVDGAHHDEGPETCVRMSNVMATTLSDFPFAVFSFDGIVGLGLPQLSISPSFSLFESLFQSGQLRARQFGVYLAEAGEGSEIAFGGPNPDKLASQITWTPVVNPQHGHWQVELVALHVGNYTLEACRSGGCRGILDTGTSHLAIPKAHEMKVIEMLSQPVPSSQECRYVDNPPIIVELRGINLTIYPEDYMRQLPVPDDIVLTAGPAPTPPSPQRGGSADPPPANDTAAQASAHAAGGEAPGAGNETEEVGHSCRPRVVGINLPEPAGPLTLILGQPIFHRYYTVFNFEGPLMGFGLAAPRMLEHGHHADSAAAAADGAATARM